MKTHKVDCYPLFATTIGKFYIDPSLFNREEIVDQITKNYQTSKTRNKWLGGKTVKSLHHMYDDYGSMPEPDFNILCKEIYPKFLQEYFSNLGIINGFKFEIVNYTAIGINQGMDRHSHGGFDFSMVHYLSVPKNSIGIKFFNPSPYAQLVPLPSYIDKNNMMSSGRVGSWILTPEDNEVIVFPSYLEHEVPISDYNSEDLRIAIVCNIDIEV